MNKVLVTGVKVICKKIKKSDGKDAQANQSSTGSYFRDQYNI